MTTDDASRFFASGDGGHMRLGRLGEQVRAYNWFGVVIELAVVIVGVLIAIQVANWNQDRLDRERGRQYYQRIEVDLRQQIVDLRGRETYYAVVKQYGERALADFDRPASQLDQQFPIALYQASQVVVGPLARTNYDEAARSGDFRNVADPELRTLIASHFDLALPTVQVTNERPAYRDRIRRVLPYALQLEIIAKCGDHTAIVAGGVAVTVLPSSCTIDLDAAQARRVVAALRATPELKNDLTRYLMDLGERVSLLTPAREEAETLLTQMQTR